ncbi:MAG TPA: hypothetical protein VFB62_07400 [Polyangiaceae bacterium]|jgi:hypothetical protein|nr:hypothetical protein [Polyangiaceae bacterium]
MEVTQASCKIFTSRYELESRELIAVFHRWIQTNRTRELLIDVADYSHVHGGPGVMLLAHECCYALDHEERRPGLRWRARRGEPLDALMLLRAAVLACVRACRYLEEDLPGRIAFGGRELLVGFDDRLRAPNTPETFEALRSDLEELGRLLFAGEAVSITPHGDPRACFRARLTADRDTPLAALESRLAG